MPIVPKPRIGRLATVNRHANAPTPKVKAKEQREACCDKPEISDEDGAKVCQNCGTQISESNIVADVTFQEDSRGAATVQGGFIGENARHARTLGTATFRRIGGGERNSLQEIENNGRRALQALCPRLAIPDNVQVQAQALFSMAATFNFNAGRKTDEVVAACLYAACRRDRNNNVLLIDIAELLKISVFRLGEVWKDLRKAAHYYDESVGVQHVVDIEPLVGKYCAKLEFGTSTHQVAEDAIRIIRRMKRDWMATGRHPSGLCGASIILAARMNNFRRSVREVVLVAKVADMTIAKRIEEFRRTKASTLSVDQFRQYGVALNYDSAPPIMQYNKEKQARFEEKQRQRQAESVARESMEPQTTRSAPIVIPDDDSNASSSSPSPAPSTSAEDGADEDGHRPKRRRTAGPSAAQQPLRIDADGFAIPAPPTPAAIDPAITGGSNAAGQPQQQKRKRGRPPKNSRPEPVVTITPEELATEEQVKNEIEHALEDQELNEASEEQRKQREEEDIARAGEAARRIADSETQLAAEKNRERREAEGVNWWADRTSGNGAIVSEAELEAEFAEDPEVLNCLLTADEAKIKEQIWVAHNEDWLRSQHEKDLMKALNEANGKDKDSSKRGRKDGKPKKKRSKLGDRSVLEEAETPIDTPADATNAMLKKRANNGFSKFIDYEKLTRIYNPNATPPTSTSQSRAGTEDASSRAGSVTPSAASRQSATPAPPVRNVRFGGLQSPQATQRSRPATATPATPRQPESSPAGRPPSPPATQAQAGAENDELGEQDEYAGMDVDDDYQSEGSGPAGGWDEYEGGDDREDIGEDDNADFYRAIDPMNTGEDYYADDDGYE